MTEPGMLMTIVEISTVVSTLVLVLSVVPLCFEMYRKKDVTNSPLSFFVMWMILSLNGLVYSMLAQNNVMNVINYTSIAVTFLYIGVYLRVTRFDLSAVVSVITSVVVLGIIHYFAYNGSANIDEFILFVGGLGCLGGFIMNILPITEVINCFQQGNSAAIMMPILICGSINMICWIAYGLLLDNPYIVYPNVPAVVVNALRFVVVFKYPKKTRRSSTDKDK